VDWLSTARSLTSIGPSHSSSPATHSEVTIVLIPAKTTSHLGGNSPLKASGKRLWIAKNSSWFAVLLVICLPLQLVGLLRRPAHAVDVAADVLLLNAARSVVPDQGRRGASAGASRIHVELSQLALPRYWPFG